MRAMEDEIRHVASGPRGAFVIEREQRRLLPLCPFAKSVFDKTPAYADVCA